ncbi:hypothetical protein NEPAR06_1039 [Nematocida parisii]|uniref:Uncharacterized protein n=1 Tax=Nematocida parisii (strain ERTm3) TaxID=935791 RepID=I3EFL5_NEMP3|nr:uncharacterized protein NEPG_01494 [Nematocida parisii ERTm1]EIJ88012.1 hypothetical protein NEQG_01456 [Nematocida parisii ERTm3]KAI5128411.1 hypothetical protein NEPAR08_1222 [Nematocida parisii]EIJ93922.1 hypothetical protein NEPG_01494 [Nematocida parisii ERTm1]KAI5128502.1 hypothetical protein NEPAR03_1356 [Nematocida parisii]KAI5143437.1 hypothetical protein NEPAR04_1828 [Nematocida parisii]|eukprot:XP_013059322.1 hypothetical protein NEPG_01494 [Nematocida parisii ERTm1]
MDSSLWDEDGAEMDLIKKESLQREKQIENEDIRTKRESEIEKARIITESALEAHSNTLLMFLGYVKAVAMKEDRSIWIESEARVWNAIKQAIAKNIEEGTEKERFGEIISKKILEIVESRERSIASIERQFQSLEH